MLDYFTYPVKDELYGHFSRLYGRSADLCMKRLDMMIGRYGIGFDLSHPPAHWSHRDVIMITYPDMIRSSGDAPLVSLKSFADTYLSGAVSTIHLLPFFPYSSDDGFSVIHFRTVNPEVGSWENVQRLGKHFRLMFDLVLNHVSRKSGWFSDYQMHIAPGRNYFIEVDPSEDLSTTVRPRSIPLLTCVNTSSGRKHVWTTFSSDQIDLNYKNPDVLFEMLDILLFYISMGARIIRLDAIAYLWKKVGTKCIHLPETHRAVKIIRKVLDMVAPDVLLVTETNVPHEENVSYFGHSDEAHMVYQFTLPPLILHALTSGSARYLTEWTSSLPDPPDGCTYFNFTASHDGIGLRPLEHILPPQEVTDLIKKMHKLGARISTFRRPDGTDIPYEVNITYFDALGFPNDYGSDLHIARFMCSQLIALAMKGIPGIYFNSLIASGNDYVLAVQTGQARSINRTKWEKDILRERINTRSSIGSRVFTRYLEILKLRVELSAFHPDGEQHVFDLEDEALFCIERVAPNESQTILAVHNISESVVKIDAKQLEKVGYPPASCRNLLKSAPISVEDHKVEILPYEVLWLTPSQ